tara:strand:+ start:4644 stop:5567 length:924 start_codon:yes stop_codon:yes gene_type:complete
MSKPPIEDVLSWDKFLKETLKEDSHPPKKIKLFNRLMAHSNNFFIISAIGAFSPGYLMLISKKLVPSFSLIDDEHLDELKWLAEVMKNAMQKTYDRNTVVFEHGMCACVGGLDRAHMHLMTISKNANDNLIKDSINKALIKRKAGITSVEINGHKLENIHDILQISDSADAASYKINGKQLLYEDIQTNLDVNNWPASARPHVRKGGHYVYFKTNNKTSSFFTDKNFQTQLGRQIVYELEKKTNPTFKNMSDEILKKNNYANIWKWQEFSFKENMLNTMHDLIPALLEVKKDSKSNKFNFQIFEKKN